jgi:hypothetical protein
MAIERISYHAGGKRFIGALVMRKASLQNAPSCWWKKSSTQMMQI